MPKNRGRLNKRASNNPGVGSDCSTSQHSDVRYHENPVKSDPDPNEYRVIELPNGLVALLISCPTDPSIEKEDQIIQALANFAKTKNSPWLDGLMATQNQQLRCPAACCLCVNAGSFNNPRQVPGLSHVLGYAILDSAFKSNPKISSECKKILKRSDAFEVVPQSETTIFYIETTHRVFREAIEEFGRSLESVVPKYHLADIRQAVQHFGEMLITFSLREKEHIFSQFVSREHPAKTFRESYLASIGQINTDTLHREVQKFHKRHYSAHRMTLVMKAKLPLDTLETHARECFSRITNNGLPPQLFDSYNFANSVNHTKFRRIWRIDSTNCNEMSVNWIIPPSSWLYKTKSLEFLGWLFSYGGAGSLMNYLIMKKWATNVRGRVLNEPAWNTSLYSTFCVSVTLTAIGNSKNKLDVLDAIYSYINFLRREGMPKSIYEDVRIIRNAEFRYRKADLRKSTDLGELAENMHLYPSSDYLAAPHFWYEYDPVSLSTCLDLMTPMKACIMVTDESFGEHLDTKLAGLGRGEKSMDIPDDWIARWQTIEPFPGFKLAERNIFCPDDLRMNDAPAVLSKYPVKVHSDSMSEVWYKFDPECRVPKGHMNFCYVSPLPLESPENAAMRRLFCLVLKDLTHDKMYPATVAGLSYTIESYFVGLGIEVSGYTQKLPLLTQIFAQSIPESYQFLTKSLFETKKQELLDGYSRFVGSDIIQAQQISGSILMAGRWDSIEMHTALSRLQFERFQHFMKHYVDQVYIKCLVEGNIAEDDAVRNALRVVEVSQCGPLSRDMIPRLRMNKIPPGKHCCTVKGFGLDSSNVVVQNLYQFDDSTLELGGILCCLLSPAATEALDDPTPGMCKHSVNTYTFQLIDSGAATINAKRIASVDAEIEKKIHIARVDVENCINNGSKLTKDAIIAVLRKLINSPASEFTDNWSTVVSGEYDFGNTSRQLDALDKMDSAEFHKWMQYITNDSNIRKLSIRIVGDNYSRADFSTVNTRPDKPNTGPNNSPLYRLQHLTEHAGQTENTSYNCITDIYEFKKQLDASSNTNITS